MLLGWLSGQWCPADSGGNEGVQLLQRTKLISLVNCLEGRQVFW